MATRSIDNGFTLVELIVTLVIIGALAAVSAPIFFTKRTYEERGFFNEMLASVRHAQKLAVATCSPVRVNISANGYALFRAGAEPVDCNNPCTAAGTGTPVQDPTDNTGNFTRTAPSGIALSPVGDILFCPLGNADANVTVNVGGQLFQVWAATGFVQRL